MVTTASAAEGNFVSNCCLLARRPGLIKGRGREGGRLSVSGRRIAGSAAARKVTTEAPSFRGPQGGRGSATKSSSPTIWPTGTTSAVGRLAGRAFGLRGFTTTTVRAACLAAR